jgi:hypothetical protein
VFDSPTLLWDAQNLLSTCGAHVWQANSSDTGTMHGFGQRIFLGKSGYYAPLVSHLKSNTARHWKAIALRVFCGYVTNILCMLLKKWFPDELNWMQQVKQDAGILPGEQMCGEDGITASMDVSVDLGNASQKDVDNGSPGVSIWTELYPGKAKNVSDSGLTR